MLKKVLLGLAALLVVFLVVVAMQSSAYTVERSATFDAPPAIAFQTINSFEKWIAWSPWDAMDPGMKREYGETKNGVGATYYWNGNDKVGEGRMTITESVPNEKVRIKLEFVKPFASVADTYFLVNAEGTGSKVTWRMDGTKNFVSKAMGLFMSMDQMIGPDFEKGLANMKPVLEKADAEAKAAEAKAIAEAEAAAAAAAAATDGGTTDAPDAGTK